MNKCIYLFTFGYYWLNVRVVIIWRNLVVRRKIHVRQNTSRHPSLQKKCSIHTVYGEFVSDAMGKTFIGQLWCFFRSSLCHFPFFLTVEKLLSVDKIWVWRASVWNSVVLQGGVTDSYESSSKIGKVSPVSIFVLRSHIRTYDLFSYKFYVWNTYSRYPSAFSQPQPLSPSQNNHVVKQ